MVTPAGGIASPVFLPLCVMATPRLVGCWADVPTCGLTCPRLRPAWQHPAVGPESDFVSQSGPWAW